MPKTIHRHEYEILRQQLRDLRVAAGASQTEVSDGMGRSQSFVSDIERGVRRLDVIELRDVCLLLGTTLSEFLEAFEQRIATPHRAATKRRKPLRGSDQIAARGFAVALVASRQLIPERKS